MSKPRNRCFANLEAAHSPDSAASSALSREGDAALIQDLLDRMAAQNADFTLTFRRLCDAAGSGDDEAVRSLFAEPAAFDEWAVIWRRRLDEEKSDADARQTMMRAANPAFIPRNHLVEDAISAAVNNQDFSPFETLPRCSRRLMRISRISRATPCRRGQSRSYRPSAA